MVCNALVAGGRLLGVEQQAMRFTIEIYYDARSYKRQIFKFYLFLIVT